MRTYTINLRNILVGTARRYRDALRVKWYSTKRGKKSAVKKYRKKYNSTEWPLEYIGPHQQGVINGYPWSLETGQPLKKVPGYKVAAGAGNYLSPDGIERTIPKKLVSRRTD